MLAAAAANHADPQIHITCDRCRAEGRAGTGEFADLQDLLAFTPVPRRFHRADGWSPERQQAFIRYLAAGAGPSEAARAVGKTRQSAFALRKRPGAESFCAAWAAAAAFARERRFDASPKSAAARAREGVLVPRFYRGRLVSVERRFPSAPLTRLLAQLDAWADKKPQDGSPPIAFEDLLDMVAPKAPPLKVRRRSRRTRDELDRLFRHKREEY